MFARMFVGASIALAALLAAGHPAGAASRTHRPPGVRIWTTQGTVYQNAERVQVFFRTEQDAYVTVLRVDTDGRVRVLFPPEPGDSNLARGGETYTVAGVDDRDAFIVDDPPGVGYLFAVASQDPFAYDAFTDNDHWSFEAIASLSDGRIHGDPYESLQDLVRQIMPEGYADYDAQLLAYDVEQRPDSSAIALAAPPAPAAGQSAPADSVAHQPPGVRAWTNHGEAYQQTERVQVFFRTERDAYVTVLRVNTDGRVRVLFPREPGDPNLARGGETYTVSGVDDRDAFIVDDPPGLGYVFAVASLDPFAYDAFTENDHWSFEAIASLSDGRIHGDPYASLQDLVQQIMPGGYADYDTQLLAYDVAQRPDSSAIALAAPPAAGQSAPAASGARQLPYDVEQRDDGSSIAPAAPLAEGQATSGAYQQPYDVGQRHDYPRFLCYDCHAYTPYAYWNPYSAWCPQFSLAVYFNPFYSYSSYGYPTRYYGGTNVVYTRPGLTGRQYVFKTRADQAAPYAVYRNRAGGGMQQPPGRGVRGVDVGGVGSVPAPGGRRTLGGNVGQPRGGAAAQRQYIMGSRQETGRRAVRDAVAAPINPRGGNQRYIPQAASRQGSRGAPGYGASQAPRSGYAPQRGVYIDPGTRQRSTQSPTASGRPYQRESQRYIPQAAPRQGSRGAPGYGASQASPGMRGYGASRAPRSGYAPQGGGYGASRAPRSGYAPRGGGPGSSSPAARAAPRAAQAPRSSPSLVRRRR